MDVTVGAHHAAVNLVRAQGHRAGYGVGMTDGITDARPLQVRIADDLRQRIESGVLRPGARIPRVADLTVEWKCSTTVARRALELLRQWGLVTSQRGVGSIVRERTAEVRRQARRHGIERYARHIWAGQQQTSILDAEAASQGTTAGQKIRELAEVPAPQMVADLLEIPAGTPVWVRRRTTLWGQRWYQLADSYYPLDIADAAPAIRQENTGPGGGFARIEDAGIHLAEIGESVATRMPTGPEAAMLELPGVTPVAELLRTTYADTGRPVEVMHAVIAGDLMVFTYRAPIPD